MKNQNNDTEQYLVNLLWDGEASVWIVTSDEIPSLVLESGSLDALIERVRFAIPGLLSLNGITNTEKDIICFRSECHEQVIA